jgi:hypothetical protein
MEKFKSIPELIQSLNQLATRINKGTVGLEEFDVTLRDARELYERLVILRYKAIEDRNLMGAPLQTEIPSNGNVENEGDKPTPKQISLIDSIEEIKRETVVEPIAEPKTLFTPEESIKEEDKIPAPVIPEVLPSSRAPKEVEQKESVAEKMSHTPIKDIAAAISLNRKFQFIKELFNDNADAYKAAVERLNAFSDGTEAMNCLNIELAKKYGWDSEDPLVVAFTELVERRYL